MNGKFYSWERSVQWLKQQKNQKKLINECYYDDPIESSAERFSNSEEWTEIIEIIKQKWGNTILDVGAGRGISSYALAKAGYDVTAIEPDPGNEVGAGAIKQLNQNNDPFIKVIRGIGESMPFNANSFDIVYCRATLHHAADLNEMCRQAKRVLKPKGFFLATREHVISQKEDLSAFLSSHPLHKLYGGEYAYMLNEYINAIRQSGLKIKKVIGPFESVINYAPMTKNEFENKISRILASYFGRRISKVLSKNTLVQYLIGKYLSKKSQKPGRHYSFIAVKP